MKNNRTKGHSAERLYALKFRELFPKCQTSRYASRMMDDAGVDLVGLPMLVQIKAGLQKGMKPHEVLKNIKDNLPDESKPKVLIHHKEGAKGKKRDEFSSLVTMTFKDFFHLINLAYNDNQTK
jgi:hypothetical protein